MKWIEPQVILKRAELKKYEDNNPWLFGALPGEKENYKKVLVLPLP